MDKSKKPKRSQEYDPYDNGSGLSGYGKSPDYVGPRYTLRMKVEFSLFLAGFLALTVVIPMIIQIRKN